MSIASTTNESPPARAARPSRSQYAPRRRRPARRVARRAAGPPSRPPCARRTRLDRVELPVGVGLLDPLAVDERDPPDAGADEGLGCERPDAADPEHDDVRGGELLHRLEPEEPGGAVEAWRNAGGTGGMIRGARLVEALQFPERFSQLNRPRPGRTGARTAFARWRSSARRAPRRDAQRRRRRRRDRGRGRPARSGPGAGAASGRARRSRARAGPAGTARSASSGLRARSYVSGPANEKCRPNRRKARTWSALPLKECSTPPAGSGSSESSAKSGSCARRQWSITGSPKRRARREVTAQHRDLPLHRRARARRSARRGRTPPPPPRRPARAPPRGRRGAGRRRAGRAPGGAAGGSRGRSARRASPRPRRAAPPSPSGPIAGTTTSVTPAARARSSTASRSASNASLSRWQWVSITGGDHAMCMNRRFGSSSSRITSYANAAASWPSTSR